MPETMSVKKVLVFVADAYPLPNSMCSGAGLRAYGLVEGLRAKGHEVIVSLPRIMADRHQLPAQLKQDVWSAYNQGAIIEQNKPDVVIFCHWPAVVVDRIELPAVIDLHGPHILEREYQSHGNLRINRAAKLNALRKADFFTCAGDLQRAYFTSWLINAGFQEPEKIIKTVHVSLSPRLPETNWDEKSVRFLYGGIHLPWQDPSIAMRATADALKEATRQGKKGELHIFGSRHPFHNINQGIFSNIQGWFKDDPNIKLHETIPRDELLEFYSRGHCALDLMAYNLERELAFTTRTVEYLWCGLPVIYNDYSELSQYINGYKAGWTLPPNDEQMIKETIFSIARDPEILIERSCNAQKLVSERFTWDKTIEPLHRFCLAPFKVEALDHFGSALEGNIYPSPVSYWDRARFYLRTEGIAGLIKHSRNFIFRKLRGR